MMPVFFYMPGLVQWNICGCDINPFATYVYPILIGLVISFIVGCLFYRLSSRIEEEIRGLTKQTKLYTIGVRHDLYRMMKHIDKDGSGYWWFIWRFETMDSFSIHLDKESDINYEIKVLGQNIPSSYVGIDINKNKFYLVEVQWLIGDETSKQSSVFKKGERLACGYEGGKCVVTRYSDPYFPDDEGDKYAFIIAGLGGTEYAGYLKQQGLASEIPLYNRIKDD